MTLFTIFKKVEALKKRFRTSDPFLLAEALDIDVFPQPMGSSEEDLKGLFLKHKRLLTIIINSDMPDLIQLITCAHELGHAVLHPQGHSAQPDQFRGLSVLTRETSGKEYEANVFAAELLLEDEDVLEQLRAGLSFYDTAAVLGVPADLLAFKLKVMRKKGYDLPEPPQATDSTFLKNVAMPADELYE